MIRSLCLRQMQSVSFKRSIALRPVLRLTKCAPLSPLTASSFELSPLLVRSASSTPPPKSKATPKTSAKSATNASKPARQPTSALIYHAGVPRIMFLGALKVTTVLVFGFFVGVTIPSCVQANGPWWQIAGLAAASVTPLLSVWYLTSPMVIWMHLKVPKAIGTNRTELLKYARSIPSTAEINVLTMAPLGNARATKTTLGELRPEKRRFGLVNYVRDTTRENAERKWYHFRAVGKFKIEDGVVADARSLEKWPWYTIRAALDERKGDKVAKTQETIVNPNRALKRPVTNTKQVQGKPLNLLEKVIPKQRAMPAKILAPERPATDTMPVQTSPFNLPPKETAGKDNTGRIKAEKTR